MSTALIPSSAFPASLIHFRSAEAERQSHMSKHFRRMCRRIGIKRPGLNFYGLRRTFETIGGDLADQVAVDFIMGHVPHSSDMGAVYRQRVKDERLQAVVDHVRKWLFPVAGFVARAADVAKPIPKREYAGPADVTLTVEARQAIEQWPMTATALSALADSIVALGIPQRKLAEWWGVKFKFYQDMRYGRKAIPEVRANHLRALFGVPPMPLQSKRQWHSRKAVAR